MHPLQKLTYEDAQLMRALRKEKKPNGKKFTYKEIGEKMEVSQTHARSVCLGIYLTKESDDE
jgi:hypothetical protein